jgi:hypothetical protein
VFAMVRTRSLDTRARINTCNNILACTFSAYDVGFFALANEGKQTRFDRDFPLAPE